MQIAEERSRLDSIAVASGYSHGVNSAVTRYCAKVFARHWRPGACLELGPAEGVMTELLVDKFADLTVVEGSQSFCESLAQRFPKVAVHHALFEEFAPSRRFDTIILGHVLEHVDAPVAVLEKVASWLAPGGRICAAVPNARSVHRQAAVLMGLLPREASLNESDIHHGHRRVYDPESFRAEFLAAGLRVELFGGYWLKPLSNGQIETQWSSGMLDAFLPLGERYPDIAAEIYVIAEGR